jgi:ElaB/YqjD/DUF883 family membrane-anchored ribosome-binding protein
VGNFQIGEKAMESNKNLSEGTSTNKPTPNRQTTPASPQTASAPQKAKELASEMSGRMEAAVDQTKRAVTDAYDKTSEVLSNTYNQTMDYGRENPGKVTLIAFGAGIGIGILLASGFAGGRSTRTTRIAEPVVNALSQIAMEFFR